MGLGILRWYNPWMDEVLALNMAACEAQVTRPSSRSISLTRRVPSSLTPQWGACVSVSRDTRSSEMPEKMAWSPVFSGPQVVVTRKCLCA